MDHAAGLDGHGYCGAARRRPQRVPLASPLQAQKSRQTLLDSLLGLRQTVITGQRPRLEDFGFSHVCKCHLSQKRRSSLAPPPVPRRFRPRARGTAVWGTEFSVANTVGFLKGQVVDSRSPGVSREGSELHRVPLLGAWLLRKHRRAGRGDDSRLHAEPGRGRKASGKPGARGA